MSHMNDTAADNREQELERQEKDDVLPEQANSGQNIHGEQHADETAVPEGDELLKAKQLAEEHYQRLMRVQADYDNFRRRSRQEKEEFAKYASMKVIEQLIPVIDNFDRALEAGKDNTDPTAFVKGVEMIFRQLFAVLENEGVSPIQAVGEPFNPEFHQAVMTVESEEHEEGIIVEELQRGYMMKEKVIRPSMVKVSS